MEQKIEKHGTILFISLLLVVFCIGIFIFDDYGVGVDELFERNSGLITLKYVLVEKLGLSDLPDEIHFAGDLLTYEDRHYGVILQIPVLLAEMISGFSLDLWTVSKIRHLWVFFNFILACAAFGLLIRERFGKWFYAILSTLFLVLSPRIFADAFYNMKDLLFLSWFVISLFFLMRFLKRLTFGSAFLVCLSVALSANTRLIGGLVLFFACLFLLIQVIRKELTLRRFLLLEFFLIGVIIFLLILFLPALWEHPVRQILDAVRLFSNYDRIVPILYSGKMVSSGALPWHYLPVWIAITTPILYLLLFLCGVFFVASDQQPFSENRYLDSCMIFLFFIPIVAAILLQSTLYNGWRHFYFIFIPFLYLAVYGFQRIFRSRAVLIRILIVLAVAFSLADTGWWMIRNHPWQMVYFNTIARKFAAGNFELDYWRFSSRECLEFVTAADSDYRIDIGDYASVLTVTKYALPLRDRERLSTTSYGFGGKPAKYVIANYTDTPGNELNLPFYRPVHHVTVDGMKIASVFQRDHQDELWAQDVVNEIRTNVNPEITRTIFDGDSATGWTTGRLQNAEDYLVIVFDHPVSIHGVTFYLGADDNECPWSLQLFSSEDGVDWRPIDIIDRRVTDYTFEETTTKYLKMMNAEPSTEFNWSVYELVFHGKNLDE